MFFEKLVGFFIRFRVAVLVIMAIVTAFFLTQIFRMEMFTQFLDLFPTTHPYVQIHKQYAKYFGGAYQATLVVELREGGKYKDVFNLETLNKMHRIQYDVDLIPGVDHFAIYSIASPKVSYTKETPYGFSTKQIMPEVPKNQQELEDLKKKVFTSPINGTLVSRDQKALRLDANFIEGKIDFNKLFDGFMKIKKKEEDANHKIYLTGTPLVYGWIYHYLPKMGLIFLITSFIIVALLYGYMYQGGLWWRPFLDGIVTSIWGLGFSALMGFHFDPLIIVIPFLLSARAMSHGVQWTERFVEEYRRLNGDIQQAALITGVALFPPGLIGIVADTWALLIISITPIPMLRNLAFIGTFWALSAVFSSLVLNPALFASFKKLWIPMEYKENTFDRILKQILVRMSSWTFGKGRYITVGLAVAVLIVAVVSSTRLKYGDANPGDPILWQNSEYNSDVKKTNERFPGVDQMWVVIEGKKEGTVLAPDVVRGMEALKYHMMEDPNVGFATSVADVIKSINMLARGNDPKMEYIPPTGKEIETMVWLFKLGSAPGELDPWMNPEYFGSNVRLYLRNHEGSLLQEVIGRIKNFIKDNPKLMENAVAKPAGGLGGILAAANEVIASRNDPILIFILVVIFIHCSLTYWSILAGVIFTISLVLANFLAFTYMAFKGIGLNINTFPVVSLGIGMGVDYGLYIVSRIIEVYRVERDLAKSVRGGMVTAGRAVFFTATMMTAGVVFWYFSPLRFQAEMGLLLGILMMVNMVVGVLVLPAVINIIKPKFVTKGL
ncbi:MAG: MMPL family transporter [Thermodesulfobacteriota bacterium]|jgi:predicted RND superfamily exporter protein